MSNVEQVQAIKISEALGIVFNELSKNKEQQREIDKILLKKHNIPYGTLNELLVNTEKIESYGKLEQGSVLSVVFDVTKDNNINPSLFLNQKELNKSLKYKRPVEEELVYPFVIEDVIKYSEEEYVGVISSKDLILAWNKILTYNYLTQRPSKKKLMKRTMEIKRTPNINMESVKEITQLMLDGEYLPSTIIINILKDGNDNFDYIDGNLIIGEGTNLNLIDGAHRMYALIAAHEKDPDFNIMMETSIRHYDINKARFHIGLQNKTNRFDKNLVRFNTDKSYSGLIVKDLIQIKELKDRVETESTSIKKTLNMLTNYSVLSESVNVTFDPQSTKERYEITDMLKKFYGYLMSAYESELTKNMNESRKISWFNHHNVHVGFIVIAKKLYDKYGLDFPIDEITRIINSIDFTKNSGTELDKIMLEQGNRNSNQSKAMIRKVFEKEVENLV